MVDLDGHQPVFNCTSVSNPPSSVSNLISARRLAFKQLNPHQNPVLKLLSYGNFHHS